MPVPDRSPLKALEQLPAFGDHGKLLSVQWQDVQKKRLSSLSAWSATEVKPHIKPDLPLFYMFGGPDFLSAYQVYPGAPQFILCGLEPVGRVPALEEMPKDGVESALNQLDSLLEPMLRQGFFITRVMDKTLRQGQVYGVLPLLYVFLARTGNQIVSVEYLKLSETGKLTAVPETLEDTSGVKGVKITFTGSEASGRQELYYFREDLSDKALSRDGRFLVYLGALGPANSYLKAASYLMHMKEFTTIREFLLAHSSSILQDDSGIPYRYFPTTTWTVTLYGKYTKPINDFPWGMQPDLQKAYQAAGAAKPMPFKTGYGTREDANLLFAIKNAVK